MLYLGVDGGGTRTTAVVADENRCVLAKAVGKSINYNSIGLEAARSNMAEIISELDAVTGGEQFKCAFIGMSAISERASDEQALAFAGGVINAEKTVMDSDVYIALCALDTSEPCAVVISGTGSMVAGRSAQGNILHTGGWGYILGDEGSAYAIALEALRAGIRAAEGSAPPTLLSNAILNEYGISDIIELIDIFYNPPMERSRIAAFSPRVFECAENGDKTANEILMQNARSLANTALALLKDIPDCKKIGMWGGVFQHHPSYARMFSGIVNEKYPNVKADLLDNPPEIGALLAAYSE